MFDGHMGSGNLYGRFNELDRMELLTQADSARVALACQAEPIAEGMHEGVDMCERATFVACGKKSRGGDTEGSKPDCAQGEARVVGSV